MATLCKRARLAARMTTAGICAVAGLVASAPSASAVAHVHYRQTSVIHIPVANGPLVGDIIFANQRSGLVYFSDDSNSSLDVMNGRRNHLIAQISGFVNGGPNGVLSDDHGQVWAADGNGTVQVLQAHRPFRRLGVVKVGPSADELGFDPRDDLVAVSSPDSSSGHGRFRPYVTFISARARHGVYRVLGRVHIPAPAGVLEQPQWDQALGAFVESIRHTPSRPGGALAVINPVHRRLVKMIALSTCHAAGLAIGPQGEAFVGCGLGGPMIVAPASGRVLARYPHRRQCCADEVGYDALAGRYVAAEGGSDGPPPAPTLKPPAVLVVNARSRRMLTVIHLGNNAGPFHQATMLGRGGTLFVPEGDGIHVFRPTRG